ncbi:hypothetical protein GE061_020022 [Apolygus lucorum]|uniref:BLOC-1-related complex subunit 8 homolog n=1 Tax=Apolygus lucorum TaxID=248454 RepID=A0A8S9XC48_APOLU|nr:hypothetical protein GE061_020022 [Apolygus lucorum]
MSPYDGQDLQLESKVKKATERISENIHIIGNEPSLAFYRLQEHVRKALPPMVEKRVEVSKLHAELQGRCYDVEYAVSAVKGIGKSEESFERTRELLRNALFFKQQLKYTESRKSQNSVYKRLSAHITLDLPDLPELSETLRETASSLMNHARTATNHNPEGSQKND